MIRRPSFFLVLTLALAQLSLASAGTNAKFVDVLGTPAQKSALAKDTLLNGIAVAGKRLVCVGWRGHILYSDDGGKKWAQASVPVCSDLVAVYFPSPQKGWAVGHDGVVLHTSDGGSSWVRQFDGFVAARVMKTHYEHLDTNANGHLKADVERFVAQGADKPFLDVWFESDTTGFIVGAYNLIFRTTDGGKSWTPWFDRTDNTKGLHLYAIRPIGQDLFICGEQGLIMKLDREAGRFKSLTTPYKGTFFGITGKPGAIVAFGLRGNVFLSVDHGASWQKVQTDMQAGLTSGMVTADGRIILASQGGSLLVSEDNGTHFSKITPRRPVPVTSFIALDRDKLMMTGTHGVWSESLK